MTVYSKKMITAILCIFLVLAAPVFLHAEPQDGDAGIPTISGVKQEVTELEYNSKVNVRSGVTAEAADGQSLTNRIVIQVKGPGEKTYGTTVDKIITLKSVGTYRVMYSVTDPSNNQSATVYRAIKSVDTKAPVIQSKNNFADLKLSYDSKKVSYKALMKGITASLVSGKNMKSRVSIKIQDPDGNTSTVMKNGSYKLSGYGSYTITYLCANANKSLKTGLYLSTRETRTMIYSSPLSYTLVVPKDKTYTSTGSTIDLMKNVYVKVTDKSKKSPERVTKLRDDIRYVVTWKKDESHKEENVSLSSDDNQLILEKYGIFQITYQYELEEGETLTAVRTITISEPEISDVEENAEPDSNPVEAADVKEELE